MANAKRKVCVLGIDPQDDFVNRSGKANLPVAGAVAGADNIARMINRYGGDIDDIQLTMDSHYHIHIAHSCWWLDKNGNHPTPFTLIPYDAVMNKDFRANDPARQQWSEYYTQQLAKNKRFVVCIWKDHCIIGSDGQKIDPVIYEAVTKWEHDFYAMAARTTKGSCMFTEHYSAVKAEVEYPKDISTRFNNDFVDVLKTYDDIITWGWALSHCLNFTMSDIADDFGDDQVKKIVLMTDATSSVPGFEKDGDDFVNRMVAKGMRIATTKTFF